MEKPKRHYKKLILLMICRGHDFHLNLVTGQIEETWHDIWWRERIIRKDEWSEELLEALLARTSVVL